MFASSLRVMMVALIFIRFAAITKRICDCLSSYCYLSNRKSKTANCKAQLRYDGRVHHDVIGPQGCCSCSLQVGQRLVVVGLSPQLRRPSVRQCVLTFEQKEGG